MCCKARKLQLKQKIETCFLQTKWVVNSSGLGLSGHTQDEERERDRDITCQGLKLVHLQYECVYRER